MVFKTTAIDRSAISPREEILIASSLAGLSLSRNHPQRHQSASASAGDDSVPAFAIDVHHGDPHVAGGGERGLVHARAPRLVGQRERRRLGQQQRRAAAGAR